jgi:hypothetical protein
MLMYEIELSSKSEKALEKLEKEVKILAVIYDKIDLLESGYFDLLDIKQLNRSKKSPKIFEVRIQSPKSYRIFYCKYKEKDNKKIDLLDIIEKKTNKFQEKYFKTLDKVAKDMKNLCLILFVKIGR